jgi:hypothetical protein
MGIVHFAGLGRSPGAVTSGLAYLKHEYGNRPEYGRMIESVVLFTSPEVAEGKEPTFETTHNEYMSLTSKQAWPKGKTHAVEIVAEFFEREIKEGLLYLCQVNVNDFSASFEAVAKATLKFHRPGEVGKHLWANITGGTNPLNAALFQTAYLSGFISRLYYTFVSDMKQYGKYLQPFSRAHALFDFREIYVLKTTFDDRYQRILEELETVFRQDQNKWLTCEQLLGRLKSKAVPGFQEMEPGDFLLNFLHVMQGRGIARRGKDDAIRFDSLTGAVILSLLRSEFVQALFKQRAMSEQEAQLLTSGLQIEKLWSDGV